MSGLDNREEPNTISSLERLFWPHLRRKKLARGKAGVRKSYWATIAIIQGREDSGLD